jgi:Signal transduction histidine kinase
MLYVCIVLIIIIIFLAALLILFSQSIEKAKKQMDEMERYPNSNNQLKGLTMNRSLEGLFHKVNLLYKKRQEERIAYLRREEQIRREIENISHDLRTPLTSIIGYVDLIQDPESEEAEKQEYLQIIGKRARVLQGFIQDFYELSRMEADDYPLHQEMIEIQPIIKEATVAYYQEFSKKKIQVQVDLQDKPCHIIADKIQFHRIINNLVQNALKYAEKNFIIKQYTKDGECIIELSNDKNQIKEEDLSLIFDRFYTGDTTRNTQSTGLGLSISKVLTEKMKGRISAKLDGEMFVIVLSWKCLNN